MDPYKVTLRFDDNDHSLTKENGLTIHQLYKILDGIDKNMDKTKRDKIVLSEIRGNCYAMVFSSYSNEKIKKIFTIHEEIKNMDSKLWTKPQEKYATNLKAILGGKLNLTVYDNDRTWEISITSEDISKANPYYFERIDKYGCFTLIGSYSMSSRSKPKIKLDGEDYNILITREQEDVLKQFYKTTKLYMEIRLQKRQKDDSIKSAELIYFEPTPQTTLSESAKEFRKNFGDLFDQEIPDVDEAMKSIRPTLTDGIGDGNAFYVE